MRELTTLERARALRAQYLRETDPLRRAVLADGVDFLYFIARAEMEGNLK